MDRKEETQQEGNRSFSEEKKLFFLFSTIKGEKKV
jgi:hypothetical protein